MLGPGEKREGMHQCVEAQSESGSIAGQGMGGIGPACTAHHVQRHIFSNILQGYARDRDESRCRHAQGSEERKIDTKNAVAARRPRAAERTDTCPT